MFLSFMSILIVAWLVFHCVLLVHGISRCVLLAHGKSLCVLLVHRTAHCIPLVHTLSHVYCQLTESPIVQPTAGLQEVLLHIASLQEVQLYIALSPLFVQLMHANYYKIVKQFKSFKITLVAQAESSLMMVYVNRNMLEQLL